MKRPASRSGTRTSGPAGKSGKSGRSGKSGKSGYVREHEGTARSMFLAYVIASMRGTSKKLHGADAPLVGTGNTETRRI